jgi:hypothetical protein
MPRRITEPTASRRIRTCARAFARELQPRHRALAGIPGASYWHASPPWPSENRFREMRHEPRTAGADQRQVRLSRGGKVAIERPRVRGLDGAERVLSSWENAVIPAQ